MLFPCVVRARTIWHGLGHVLIVAATLLLRVHSCSLVRFLEKYSRFRGSDLNREIHETREMIGQPKDSGFASFAVTVLVKPL
jgi:hypothetical protein